MATDSIVGGLFATPEQYQQAQTQQALANSGQMAQLTPEQSARQMARFGGDQLAGALAGALGAQDPQLAALATIKQLSNKYDTNTSGGVAALATELQNRGLTQQAFQLGQKALEMRKIEAEAQAKTMERLTNEQKNAAAIADSSGNPRGTQEWTDAYKTELNRLTTGAAQIDKVGVAAATREPVYFDKSQNVQFIVKTDPATGKQVRVPYNGGIDQTTSRTNVNVNPGETAFVKELGVLDAKKVSEAMTSRGAAIDQLKTLQKMAEVQQRPIISGTLAEQRTDVSNFFNTIGLSSSADKLKTANSQEYTKYSTGLVLDNLKKTGYNPSNADMKVVQSIIPRLETDPAARTELIKFMAEKANEVVNESNNLETYARSNKGLTGYTPKVPQVTFGNTAPANPYANLSDAELAARIAAAQRK